MKAIVLAGGRGTRLAPYTTIFPKPLMPIGSMPIIEIILRQLSLYGFKDVTLAVGHLAELLMAYCGDGKKFDINLSYSREDEPLGTAGPIAMVPDLNDTFVVLNGDLLTNLDFNALLKSHQSSGAIATLTTFKRHVQIDFGVIETNKENHVINYIEKPKYHYIVSTGVYLFEPEVINYIIPGKKLDLPELILSLLNKGMIVNSFTFDGLWLDIGRKDDYEKAIIEFESNQDIYFPRT